MNPRLASLLLACALAAAPSTAHADTTHLVAPGHTLAKIAKRYHVSIEALREANKLVPGQRLKPGQRIVVPDASGPASREPAGRSGAASARASLDEEHDSVRDARSSRGGRGARNRHLEPYARRPRQPGFVTLTRTGALTWRGKTLDRSGRLLAGVPDAFRRNLRDLDSGASHAIDTRLIAVITLVSDHFGGRPIDVVSGYRPHSEGQYTAHSNHNVGHAIDFAVRGVPTEVVRDFCNTLKDVGVGYYPKSGFVHLDVRNANARWVDESGPGEPPRYASGPNAPPSSEPPPSGPSSRPAQPEEPSGGSSQ